MFLLTLDLLALFQPFGDAWNEWTGASVICIFCIFCAKKDSEEDHFSRCVQGVLRLFP
jgi:hypothetical protein